MLLVMTLFAPGRAVRGDGRCCRRRGHRRFKDQVLDDELALGGEEQGVRALEGDVRLDHEDEERAGHLQQEEQVVRPHHAPGQEAEAGRYLPEAQKRDKELRRGYT